MVIQRFYRSHSTAVSWSDLFSGNNSNWGPKLAECHFLVYSSYLNGFPRGVGAQALHTAECIHVKSMVK